MQPRFIIADIKDAQELTLISIDAFHTDYQIAGRGTKGGPPGYDSVEFHEKMIKESTRFFKVVIGDRIIEGFWFDQEDLSEAYLYRIFIKIF